MRKSNKKIAEDLKKLVEEIGGFGSGVNGERFASEAMKSERDPYVQVLARVINKLTDYIHILEERVAVLEEELEVELDDDLYDSLSEESNMT